jgi:hypothetical protein
MMNFLFVSSRNQMSQNRTEDKSRNPREETSMDLTDEKLAAFKTWMSVPEKTTHDLAVRMLGSSYIPSKTHLYKKYVDSLASAGKKG